MFAYQALGACFKPYKARLSLHTLEGSPADSKPSGISIYTSSSNFLLRNAVFTSICLILHFLFAAMVKTALTVEKRTTGANVSK